MIKARACGLSFAPETTFAGPGGSGTAWLFPARVVYITDDGSSLRWCKGLCRLSGGAARVCFGGLVAGQGLRHDMGASRVRLLGLCKSATASGLCAHPRRFALIMYASRRKTSAWLVCTLSPRSRKAVGSSTSAWRHGATLTPPRRTGCQLYGRRVSA